MKSALTIVQLIPVLFHRMRAVGDMLHKDFGVTTPMRGVMQSLYDGGAQTVPQMAAARPVSRQHIQTLVDELADRGLVRAISNPKHKRSSLIELTEQGRTLFEKMRAVEAVVIGKTLGSFPDEDIETVKNVLGNFAGQLQQLIHEKDKDQENA